MPLLLRVEDTEGERPPAEYSFTRSPVRVGRSAHNDLCLPRRFVSAWHGLFEHDASGARYTDLGSTNGTLLDGAPVPRRGTVDLAPGAELSIGPLRLSCTVRDAEPPPPPTPPGTDHGAPAVARATVEEAPPELARVAPGGITAMMRKLAAAPADDFDRAWRRVLVPGAVIGRFELIREVGRGAMGVVFEARDRQLGRLVAFKAVKPGRESQFMLRQELMQQEAEAAAQLNHPNIVSLYDVGTCDSGPYLIMELLRGETLHRRMQRERLSVVEALDIAIDVAWALDHAHAAGVVHRDLKPANVFLCTTKRAKVLDFGIATVLGAAASRAVGTPAYMAPEQWRQGPQDARTDIFGAAAMLVETLTGRLPYRVTGEWSAVLDPGARPSISAPDAPPQLVALLRRALSPNPDERPRDGQAWLTELLHAHESLEGPDSVEVLRKQPAQAAPRRKRRARQPEKAADASSPRMLALVTVLVATALIACAYLLLS